MSEYELSFEARENGEGCWFSEGIRFLDEKICLMSLITSHEGDKKTRKVASSIISLDILITSVVVL